MRLSILDLIPVHENQTSGDALAATLAVVEAADQSGLHRYWFAEHHNMASVASTAPPVTIAAAAARTDRIRLGAGGVMLPNHTPFVVAEQFAMLEGLAPGRIDLGLGRAPGSDPVVTALLRSSGPTSDVNRFPEHVSNIMAMLETNGAELRLAGDKRYEVRATPAAAEPCPVWLLGSSDYSAALAAELGLPYVFAHHFSGDGTERALEIYRRGFTASDYADHPVTFVTVNCSVAPTEQEALDRAMPMLIQMSKLQTGKPLTRLHCVETAPDEPLDAMQRQIIETMRQRWIIGDPASVARQLADHADRFGVDEVMVQFACASRVDEPVDRSVGREQAVRLLSEIFVAA